MNRRDALKSLAALAGVAIAAPLAASSTPSRPIGRWMTPNEARDTFYGHLTVDGCLARGLNPSTARVLDGVDVTHLRVQAADDRLGFIQFLKRDARGRCYFADGELVTERRYGRVAVTFGQA